MSARSRGGLRLLTRVLVVAPVALGSVAAVGTGASTAATPPVIEKGDLITVGSGGLFTGPVVYDIDPGTGERTPLTSGGLLKGSSALATNPAGDVYIGGLGTGVIKVDHQTGKQVRVASPADIEPTAMARAANGELVMTDRGAAAMSIVSLNPADGSTHLIAIGKHVSGDVRALALEFDGSILALDTGFDQVVRFPAGTGETQVVSTFPADAHPTGMVVAKDDSIRVRLRLADGRQQLVRVDRTTGAQKVLASTTQMGPSQGMARAADGTIIDAQSANVGPSALVRFDATGGARSTVATVEGEQIHALTVAGVGQINPVPLPLARGNTYTMERPATQLHVDAATGPLSNDEDPAFGRTLVGELTSQTSHGFVSFLSNGSGEFFYFPDAGFTGTDSFTYRVRTPDGRVSPFAIVAIKVLPDQRPVAKPDFFLAAAGRTTTVAAGGVLFNDTDPQGDPLVAKLLAGAQHGLAFVDSDGTVTYTPAAGFSGEDTFTYEARDPQGHRSAPTTVTIRVDPPSSNNAPTVGAIKGGSLGADGLSGTFALGLFDFETPREDLRLTATSSNTTLVPKSGIVLGGTGGTRTLAIKATAGVTGSSTVTVTVTDGSGATGRFTVRVAAGTGAGEQLVGTDGSDLLLGLGGGDTLLGRGGFDLLAGGGGSDVMTGGLGTDAFRGHAGTNSVTDLRLDLGETMVEAQNRA